MLVLTAGLRIAPSGLAWKAGSDSGTADGPATEVVTVLKEDIRWVEWIR